MLSYLHNQQSKQTNLVDLQFLSDYALSDFPKTDAENY